MISDTLGATFLAVTIAAFVTSGEVAAHSGAGVQRAPGYGMGSGMMGGQRMGRGMMSGQGMAHGMMGGQGMGHGMMNGHGMGHGMMSGHGMGRGMMGGHGMGHGMMGGDADDGPALSSEQRKQMSRIKTALRKHNWALQGDIIDARGDLAELYADETRDAKKIGAAYAEIFDLRRQMIEAVIDAQNRQRLVFTEEQREQLRQGHADQDSAEHDHEEKKQSTEMGGKMPGR